MSRYLSGKPVTYYRNLASNAIQKAIYGTVQASKRLHGTDPGWVRYKQEQQQMARTPSVQGTGRSSSSSLSIGSTSVDLGRIVIRDPRPWIKRASNANAEAKRAARELGAELNPYQLVKDVEYFRVTSHDNNQGQCAWLSYPVLNPSELDQLALKYTTDLRSPNIACQLHYIYQEHIFRCASTAKAELDCWLLWPKRDIPANSSVVWDNGSTSYPLSDGWFYGHNPPFMQYGFGPYTGALDYKQGTYVTANVLNSNPDYKVSPTPYNDWLASPYENQYITDNFNIDYKFHRIFNPGDELSVITGVPNQFIYPFDQVEMDMKAGQNVAFKNVYAHMRRCGPITLFRMRGRLSHLEVEGSATNPTLGLFSFDMATVRSVCTNKVALAVQGSMMERGTLTTGRPSHTNQGLASATFAFTQTAPADTAMST